MAPAFSEAPERSASRAMLLLSQNRESHDHGAEDHRTSGDSSMSDGLTLPFEATGTSTNGLFNISNLGDGVAVNASSADGIALEAASANFIGLAASGAIAAVQGGLTGGRAIGNLACKDPVFNQLAGVYGSSEQSGVFGNSEADTGTGIMGRCGGDHGFGVRGETVKGTGVQGHSFGAGTGVVGISDRGHGIHGQNGTGSGLLPPHNVGTGVSGESDNGIGVYASSKTNVGLVGESQTTNGVLGVTHSQSAAAVSGVNKNGGIGVFGEGRIAGFFSGDVQVTGNLNMSSATSDIVLGDVAEGFSTQDGEIIEPGTVVVLNQHGLVRPGDEAYDKKVVGVVSGAGEYRPAIVLDNGVSPANRLPVALMGKVCCKVDARYSSIDVGDLLTTSPTPGHAMKAADPLKAFGSVIGKALRSLHAGQGLIPILIALQ